MKPIEKAIHFNAGRRVRVRITRRTRSKHGFIIYHPADSHGRTITHAQTKRGALAALLAIIRCAPTLDFRLVTADTPLEGLLGQVELKQ